MPYADLKIWKKLALGFSIVVLLLGGASGYQLISLQWEHIGYA